MAFIDRSTKLRMRRIFRRRQKQVESATSYAEQQFESNFFSRLDRLLNVRRFVASWLILMTLAVMFTAAQTVGLSQYFLATGAVPGGVYNEGIIGSFTNANPIYATGSVDTSISRLMFAGLFKYDDQNQLVGDLASEYSVSENGKVYTVTLKPHLTWHDGRALTVNDVIFTYQLIQNPDVDSPLFTTWQGVKVAAIDQHTVEFTLPNAFTPFPYSLTNGIVPKHLLARVPPDHLRANSFNTTEPVGSGPFKWSALQLGSSVDSGSASALIALKPFAAYNGGEPKLAGFIMHTYDTEDQLIAAYRKHSVMAAVGLTQIPNDVRQDSSTHLNTFPTTAETMIFFKNTDTLLSDATVRKALTLATDRQKILALFHYSVIPAHGPLLIGQLGYDKAYNQAGFDMGAANATLDQAGWQRASNGIREKNGVPLRFQLLVEDTPSNQAVAKLIQQSWKQLGADIQLASPQPAEFQAAVDRHEYTALLHSISIGVDPDVYVYWDSSQADVRSQSRLNFSEYKSTAADIALEAGRTRQDPALRSVKYKTFQRVWQQDNPAVALFQPNDVYVTRGKVTGLPIHAINLDADRYYSVQNWQIKTGQIDK